MKKYAKSLTNLIDETNNNRTEELPCLIISLPEIPVRSRSEPTSNLNQAPHIMHWLSTEPDSKNMLSVDQAKSKTSLGLKLIT